MDQEWKAQWEKDVDEIIEKFQPAPAKSQPQPEQFNRTVNMANLEVYIQNLANCLYDLQEAQRLLQSNQVALNERLNIQSTMIAAIEKRNHTLSERVTQLETQLSKGTFGAVVRGVVCRVFGMWV